MSGQTFIIDKLQNRNQVIKRRIPEVPFSKLPLKWDLPRNQRFSHLISTTETIKHSLQLHFRSCELRKQRVHEMHRRHTDKLSKFKPFPDDPYKGIPFSKSKVKKNEEFTEFTKTVIPKLDAEYFTPYHLRFPHDKGKVILVVYTVK